MKANEDWSMCAVAGPHDLPARTYFCRADRNIPRAHAQGVAGAPKFGDKAEWAPRIKIEMDTVYSAGPDGKPGTGMVAKGGNTSLSDADVKVAVDFMVAKAR